MASPELSSSTSYSLGHSPTNALGLSGDSNTRPSLEDVLDMLDIAEQDAINRYRLIPELARRMKLIYTDGVKNCINRDDDHVEVLLDRLKAEREVLDNYQHHVEDEQDPAVPAIPETIEAFPLRNEAAANWELPDDILKPIYRPRIGPRYKKGKKVYDKLTNAPPPNLDFPNINMTLAEIVAFLPHAIKSWDVIDRFVGNGGTQTTYAKMINHYRNMPRGDLEANSAYKMMKRPMEDRAKTDPRWKGWSTGNHTKLAPANSLNPNNLSVAGFRRPTDGKIAHSAPPIPIRDLSLNVKVWPWRDDALDLARVVEYCVYHPNEDWMYPDHVEYLVHALGPAPVKPGHLDRAVITRFTTPQMVLKAQQNYRRKRDSHGRIIKDTIATQDTAAVLPEQNTQDDAGDRSPKRKKLKKGKKTATKIYSDGGDNDDMPQPKPSKRRKISSEASSLNTTPRPPTTHRKRSRPLIESDSDYETDSAEKRRPKRIKRTTSGLSALFDKDSGLNDGAGVAKQTQVQKEVQPTRRSTRTNRYAKSYRY